MTAIFMHTSGGIKSATTRTGLLLHTDCRLILVGESLMRLPGHFVHSPLIRVLRRQLWLFALEVRVFKGHHYDVQQETQAEELRFGNDAYFKSRSKSYDAGTAKNSTMCCSLS